jgi:F0F1-type ATP synthase epsilon subunit
MMTNHSPPSIHVVVQTPYAVLLDTVASELELEDQLGRFTVRSGDAALAAIVPSEIVVRRHDGSEAHIDVSWGSLTAVGSQVRIVVRSGLVEEVEALRIAV